MRDEAQPAERKYLDNGFPDRLCVDERSPYFCKVTLMKQPRVFFNGVEQPGNVEEYCVSEGWIRRVARGAKQVRMGRRLAFKVQGVVEVKPKH